MKSVQELKVIKNQQFKTHSLVCKKFTFFLNADFKKCLTNFEKNHKFKSKFVKNKNKEKKIAKTVLEKKKKNLLEKPCRT